MSARKNWSVLVPVLGGILIASVWTGAMAAGKRNGVVPADSKKFARNCDALSTDWWQWLLSIPADRNPALDTTGENAAEGQSGHVWYLAGVFGFEGGTVERDVTIPPGKALFFPVYNYVIVNTPEFGDPEWSPQREAEARQLAAEQVEQAEVVTVEVDGRPVDDITAFRCQTDEPFMVTLPDGNVFNVPAGTYGPSISDGYYLLLRPLPPGEHTIHFVTESGDTSQDVTYHITVGRR